MSKPQITWRQNQIQWWSLSGADFEKICFQLIDAEPGYADVRHTGAIGGDGGRDICADNGSEKWCFQCKNKDNLRYRDGVNEITKLYAWPDTQPPDRYVFVGPFTASQDLQTKLKKFGSDLRPPLKVDFWGQTELDSLANRHPLILGSWFANSTPAHRQLVERVLGQPEAIRARWGQWVKRSRPLTLPFTSDLGLCDLDSPLAVLWEQFIASEPWHVVMQSRVRDVCQQFAVLGAAGVCHDTLWEKAIAESEAIDWEGHYDRILMSLTRFLGAVKDAISLCSRDHVDDVDGDASYAHQLSVLTSLVNELRKALVSPRFGTCFLVAGSHGSGKSFFIDGLRRSAAGYPEQPVYIFPFSEDARLTPRVAVLREIENVFGVHDLGSLSEVTKYFTQAHIKLVIVVEDVEVHCSVRGDFLDSLLSYVEDSTASGCVRWLITINDSHYSDVARCRRKCMKASHLFTGDDSSIVGGWVRLDDLNRKKALPSELWMSKRTPRAGANLMPESERLRESSCAARVLPTPLVACIAIAVAGSQKIELLHGLSYIGILTMFWEHLLETHGAAYGLADYSKLTCAVERLADLVVKGGSFSIERTAAEEALKTCGDSVTLDRLQRLSLLTTDSVPGVDLVGLDEHHRRVHLLFELMWSYHLAYGIAKQWLQDQVSGIDVANSACLDKCMAVRDEGTRQLVYEHVLLLADEWAVGDRLCGGVPREHATALWTRVRNADCKGGEAAAYFAGVKATSERQSELLAWLRREEREVTSPQAMCALMDFLREHGTTSLDVCLQILRRKTARDGSPFRRIADADLGECFLFLFRRRIESRERWTHGELNTLLKRLANCDVMGYAEEVSEALWGRYQRDESYQKDNVVNAIQQYLVNDTSGVQEEQVQRQRPEGGRPVFLREWFLQRSLADLLKRYGLSLFDDLSDRKWFIKGKSRFFDPEIAHQVRQFWCLAFGKWYRDNAEIDQNSLTLVSRLIRSGRDGGYERKLGYFMMRATGPGEGVAPRRLGREWARVVQAGGNSIEKLLEKWPICY